MRLDGAFNRHHRTNGAGRLDIKAISLHRVSDTEKEKKRKEDIYITSPKLA